MREFKIERSCFVACDPKDWNCVCRNQMSVEIDEFHCKIMNFIQEVNAANPIMEDIFLYGSCFNFYFMLKCIFPEAEAYTNVDHVITKINGRFYDITGEIFDWEEKKFSPIGSIWADPSPYNSEKTYKNGEMYILSNKAKYVRK